MTFLNEVERKTKDKVNILRIMGLRRDLTSRKKDGGKLRGIKEKSQRKKKESKKKIKGLKRCEKARKKTL